jgi:hypothetical protein
VLPALTLAQELGFHNMVNTRSQEAGAYVQLLKCTLSGIGTKRTCRHVQPMSAFGGKADSTEWSHSPEVYVRGPRYLAATCKLYALDITLDLRGATKAQIERAMQGHVLANAELIGTYQKGDR